MWISVLLSTLLSTLVILTSVFGQVHVGCLPGTIGVGDLCYKWFADPRRKQKARLACRQPGGNIANMTSDIVKTLNTDLLPMKTCFWIDGDTIPKPAEYLQSSDYRSVRLLGSLVMFLYGDALCYVDDRWKARSLMTIGEHPYVCEYDQTSIQLAPSRNTYMTRREKVSTLIKDSPLFTHVTPLPTMCSRMCRTFTGCFLFNYNIVTRECRGFEHKDRPCIKHHVDWELWVVE